MSAAKSAKPARKPRTPRVDAISLLRADHKKVDDLFKSFEKMKEDDEKKADLVKLICSELKAHTTVEEEILYPAARDVLDDTALIDEADVEHAGAKQLIHELDGMKPGDDHYDAKVTVLAEYIRHHVKEEHTDMFPKIRKTSLDLKELGAKIRQRKQELLPGEKASFASRMMAGLGVGI